MPDFVVLARPDGSDRTLVCADQRAAAEAHGYTVVEHVVAAPTRGRARVAWDAARSDRPLPAIDDVDDAYGLEALADAELAAVVGLVAALVDGDRDELVAAGAYADPDDDPYRWTRSYGRWGRVDLVVPPGEPRHWGGGVIRAEDDPSWLGVVVELWTAQEGPSDLSLELDLRRDAAGTRAVFRNLHVR